MIEYFNVDKGDLTKIIAIALEKGGNYADLYCEHTIINSLSLQDGIVNRADTHIDYGVGIRVVSGDRQGYAFVENIVLEEMIKAARIASQIANGPTVIPSVKIEKKYFGNYYPIPNLLKRVSVKTMVPYLQKLNNRIFELDKRVIKVNVFLRDSISYILYYNSEGILCQDVRPMVQLACSCTMQQGDKIENAYTSRAARNDVSFITDTLVEEIAQEIVGITNRLFEAIRPQGGEMPIVMGAGSSGILLHEAIGHAFEADFNRKNISVFADKLGKTICDKHISVVDSGCINYDRGCINFDDEGIASQKTYIINEGRLTSYLHDRISAQYYNVEPTGNGRRQSFRYVPIPRMRCTYMENGDYSEEEIVASVKKGIYVDNFTNGEVKIGVGDFTFFVKLGYLVENGKLTDSIKDINIIGNGPKALMDIVMVGNNLKIDQGGWTCGKDGQSCPVSHGLPSVLVKKLTIGGK